MMNTKDFLLLLLMLNSVLCPTKKMVADKIIAVVGDKIVLKVILTIASGYGTPGNGDS
jgi:hypothetical protein